MSVPYDVFTSVFLQKVTEYDFLSLEETHRNETVDGYMKRSCSQFNRLCRYDLSSFDDTLREFTTDIPEEDLEEIVDIVTEGMLVQWMKPFVYKQEHFENLLNTRDFTSYSTEKLLNRVHSTYEALKKSFVGAMREYSYNYGDLTGLHT